MGDAFENTQDFLDALEQGSITENSLVHFANFNGDEDANIIAAALESGNCPQGLHINLEENDIGKAGLQALIAAILSGKCPLGLRVHGIVELSKHLNIALETFIGNDSPNWPSKLNAIRGVFCYEPSIVMEDNELKQTIQNILEDYIDYFQANTRGAIRVKNYREIYFPCLKDIAKTVLAMYEISSPASTAQKEWVNTLMLILAEAIMPRQFSHWPSYMSLWVCAQRLIFLEKAFSLFPDASASTFLAHLWQCFCDEFNETSQSEWTFQRNGDVGSIKGNAANARAVAYYNQVLKKGLVLPEIELAKQALSTKLSQTNFFQQQQRSTDNEKSIAKLYVGQSPAA